MHIQIIKASLLTMFLVVCLSDTGCRHAEQHILGNAITNTATVSVQNLKSATGKSVLVKGVMIEKCPVAGCWFKLRDHTGVVRVDTKAAGFVVTNVPLNTELSVAGKIVAGDPVSVAATGVSYR